MAPPDEPRRERHRRQLLEDITAEARRLLEAGGPSAVGWNVIARAVGLSPSSLYTYFASLDALFTELLLESYGSLRQAIEEALREVQPDPLQDQLIVGALAYRAWATTNPRQFNLVFTDQIRGYAAEPGGPTTDAQVAVLRPLARIFAALLGLELEQLQEPGPALDAFLGLWGTIHGLTMLEANHHLDWVDAQRLFEAQVRWQLAQLSAARRELPEGPGATAHSRRSSRKRITPLGGTQ